MSNFRIQAACVTDTGLVRASNQDSVFCDDKLGLFMVADGMGGHAGGETASKLCIETVVSEIESSLSTSHLEELPKVLRSSFNTASEIIFDEASNNSSLKGMGTTATLAAIVSDRATIAHVGDSRCYLVRNGSIKQLTTDHSLVAEEVRQGRLTEKEAKNHKLKNVITRCIGIKPYEETDVIKLRVFANDALVLCSDGLHAVVSDEDILSEVSSNGTLGASSLKDLAIKHGGPDNVSVCVVSITEDTP